MKSKNELVDTVNGNQLGQGPEARRFFELRGFANRKPGQANVGDCMVWHALENAAAESNNQELIAAVAALNNCPVAN